MKPALVLTPIERVVLNALYWGCGECGARLVRHELGLEMIPALEDGAEYACGGCGARHRYDEGELSPVQRFPITPEPAPPSFTCIGCGERHAGEPHRDANGWPWCCGCWHPTGPPCEIDPTVRVEVQA